MNATIIESSPGILRRIVAFPLSLLLIGGFWVILITTLIGQGYDVLGLPRNTPQKAFGAVLLAAGVIGGYKLFKRWVERAPDHELAWQGAGRELGLGLLLGAGIFAVATGIVAIFGGFEVLGVRGWGHIWSMLAVAIVSGVFEETLFRGIIFRHIETMLGSWTALAITSALFGAAHIMNPGATWFAAFAIALEAGLLLGAAYLLTRRLWLAIGVHAAWNFTQGWVFSIPVSGGDAPLGLLITRRLGPDWLTGGDFGLEASVVALVAASLAGLGMLAVAVRRGRIVGPMWSRRPDQTKL